MISATPALKKGHTMAATVTAPAAVTGFGCVYLPVSDAYTAAQWYQRIFGLEPSPNTPLRPEMPHAILHCSSRSPGLFLLTCANVGASPIRRVDGQELLTFCFLVDDIQAVLTRLKANHVRLESEVPLDRGSCGINVKCYDPDGNKFELVQPAS